MKKFQTKEEFKIEFERRMIETYGRSIEEAHISEKYMTLGEMIRDYVGVNWKETKEMVEKQTQKQMYYFSMEFLMGRLLTNNLMNLGIDQIVKEGLADFQIDLNELEDLESDAGLGNGGLGRLAACFLDSLASLNYIGHGNCIRYEYGLFQQRIEDHKQYEYPDIWMKLGNVWEVRKPKHAIDVKFGGKIHMYLDEKGKTKVTHIPDQVIRAVPYDVPIIGAHNKIVNTLRLWSAEASDDQRNRDFASYLSDVKAICMNVYPDDSTEKGKLLRMKQEYFFVAAGLGQIIQSHLRVYPSLDNLADQVCIQLNDTHPVFAIPELMRILMDEYEYEWNDAWDIVTHVFSYTNHTVLSEALEKWPIAYMQRLLPRIYMIIDEIHHRYEYALDHVYHRPDLKYQVAILKEGQVHMAHLAIVGCHHMNGVAKLHGEILKNDVFHAFYEMMPEKFSSITNGITHRRWLLYANPQLTTLLDETIGTNYHDHPELLEELMKQVDDSNIQTKFQNVKLQRKQLLANYIKQSLHIEVDVHSIFDVQAKRLHAYKRQLLNVMHIISLYQKMKKDPNFRIYPRTFIFAGKAAPSYTFAKQVIELIHCVADVVNHDEAISPYMKVVFIPNYGVSIAELLVTAADVSEQISTAGKEASGTGNMKFMMNGAITLGTMDGANVEIVERVGTEHMELFGLHADDIALLKRENAYHVWDIYHKNQEIKDVIDALLDGTFSSNQETFRCIYDELMFQNDEYFLLADFDAYQKAQHRIELRYQDSSNWAKSCLINIAKSGFFSSDRTVKEYACDIWNLKPIRTE